MDYKIRPINTNKEIEEILEEVNSFTEKEVDSVVTMVQNNGKCLDIVECEQCPLLNCSESKHFLGSDLDIEEHTTEERQIVVDNLKKIVDYMVNRME